MNNKISNKIIKISEYVNGKFNGFISFEFNDIDYKFSLFKGYTIFGILFIDGYRHILSYEKDEMNNMTKTILNIRRKTYECDDFFEFKKPLEEVCNNNFPILYNNFDKLCKEFSEDCLNIFNKDENVENNINIIISKIENNKVIKEFRFDLKK